MATENDVPNTSLTQTIAMIEVFENYFIDQGLLLSIFDLKDARKHDFLKIFGHRIKITDFLLNPSDRLNDKCIG